MRFGRLLLAMFALSSAPALAQTVTGAASPIGARFCGEVDGQAALMRCPGPAGIDAYLRQEGDDISVSLGNSQDGFIGFPGTRRLGSTMEWRSSDGDPFAGIVRYRLPGEAGGDSLGDLLAVIKVAEGERPGCLVAVVDMTVNPEGRDMARRTADEQAAAFQCGTDEARIVGISSDWAQKIVLPALR